MRTPAIGRTSSAHALLWATASVMALLLTGSPREGTAQITNLPFGVGEKLSFTARSARLGKVGSATMWIEGPVDVRGTATYVLRFDFKARVGPVKAVDNTTSWLDPVRMASLRYSKHERTPLSNNDERVELRSDERRWQDSSGASGTSPSESPLDELSFMYFVRTLPLTADTTYSFTRHFDAARSPTTVRVVRREPVTTKAGTFETVLVELGVKDPRRYRGTGVIRINLTDDTLRLPVRIESRMPMIGKVVLTLDAYTPPTRPMVARRP